MRIAVTYHRHGKLRGPVQGVRWQSRQQRVGAGSLKEVGVIDLGQCSHQRNDAQEPLAASVRVEDSGSLMETNDKLQHGNYA